jgi:hypothetical protein
VDLRRWREERDRRLKAAAAERRAARSPGRIDGLYRVLALVAGLGFVSFGAFLFLLFLMVARQEINLSWVLAAMLLVVPGAGSALFGIDLMVRGILGREWTRPLRSRVRQVMQGHKGQQGQQGQ